MNKPKRIQRRRTRGWRKPEGTIYVGRPSVWGNPFDIKNGEQKAPVIYIGPVLTIFLLRNEKNSSPPSAVTT